MEDWINEKVFILTNGDLKSLLAKALKEAYEKGRFDTLTALRDDYKNITNLLCDLPPIGE